MARRFLHLLLNVRWQCANFAYLDSVAMGIPSDIISQT